MSLQRFHVRVSLNVYDLHECNGCLYWIGLGVYHCGVELQYISNERPTKEYSYLGNVLTESTGVFQTHPRSTFGAKYRMSIEMGTVSISNRELALILDDLKMLYLAKDYDLLTKNCNHFCDDFIRRLTNRHIASWINRTASVASCCHCCIPQSFYDALIEVQTNHNLNGRQSPMTFSKSSSISSWLYQKSYLHQETVGKKRKRKRKNVDSDSEGEDGDHDIGDYMHHGHSVTVIGLNDSDHRTESERDDAIVLSNVRSKGINEEYHDHRKKYGKGSPYALKGFLSMDPVKVNGGSGSSSSMSSSSTSSSNGNSSSDPESIKDDHAQWTMGSYQQLPSKTPSPKQLVVEMRT